jgi:hypothetical protein
MNRRDLFKKLATFPFFASVLKEYEKPGNVFTVPPKPPFDDIYCSSGPLTPGVMRCALDAWGEDCDVVGHPAQRYAWNEMRLIIGNPAYSKDFNHKLVDFLTGTKFRAEYTMPVDLVEFRRDGKVVGRIRSLSVPIGYKEYSPGWNPNA